MENGERSLLPHNRVGVEKLLFGPKLANCKSAALKGCNDKLDAVICQIGLVPQHLRSLLDVIE
jgi:hypothetical protein